MFEQYAVDADVLRASIEAAKALDMTGLPEAGREAMGAGFEAALATFALTDTVREAEARLDAAVPAYQVLHRNVRKLQGDMRAITVEMEAQAETLDRLVRHGTALDEDMERIEQRIERLGADRRAIEAQIPDEWEAARERFLVLEDADKKARLRYRRNVDSAYEPVMELRTAIAQGQSLAALEDRIKLLAVTIAEEPSEQARAAIKETMTVLRSLAGANAIASKLSKARRALRGDDPDREKAHGRWLEAVALFEVETAWRRAAADKLAAGLDAYDDAIKGNIGLRLQEKFTSDQAASIAACRSIHTDISLSF